MTQMNFRLSWEPGFSTEQDDLLRREWLLGNGLGGYASGTLSGIPTRRYHGLLVAALPTPFGRQMYLNHLGEKVTFQNGDSAFISTGLSALGDEHARHFRLREFRLEEGLPIWRFELDGYVIERRIVLLHAQNTALIRYELVEGTSAVGLVLQPCVHFRSHDEKPEPLDLRSSYWIAHSENRHEIASQDSRLPSLRLFLEAEERTFVHEDSIASLVYREEKNRGYPSEATLWSPGCFQSSLAPRGSATLFASTESWPAILVHSSSAAFDAERARRKRLVASAEKDLRDGVSAQLVLAADQFVIRPAGRVEDMARASAFGEQPRSVIAGYHWFTDWGRDTMISLEGLTLISGREIEARWILHTFSLHLHRGLIPNLFPEGERKGLYHTADATLWFFHAVSRYIERTGDTILLGILLPKLGEIIDRHRAGTDFGIHMDPNDMLLSQGAEGYQLTWMDAKVDGWVVTPRRGKAVEINALWYNALRLMEHWHTRYGENATKAATYRELADVVYESFNNRFWNESTGHLFDVVDGEDGEDDPACRPNQVFALSLTYPVLAAHRWVSVLRTVETELLTPVGLRSLSPKHPDYKASYSGDLRTRDAAYHQGTVWAWLIGPYVDAWLRVYPEKRSEARALLNGLLEHLTDAGLGTISEVFDAEPPFTPRGCIAQAWSVAEVLRCLHNTAG